MRDYEIESSKPIASEKKLNSLKLVFFIVYTCYRNMVWIPMITFPELPVVEGPQTKIFQLSAFDGLILIEIKIKCLERGYVFLFINLKICTVFNGIGSITGSLSPRGSPSTRGSLLPGI